MKIEKLNAKLAKTEAPCRTSRESIRHMAEDSIIISQCTLIRGGEAFAGMEEFGLQKERCRSSRNPDAF